MYDVIFKKSFFADKFTMHSDVLPPVNFNDVTNIKNLIYYKELIWIGWLGV